MPFTQSDIHHLTVKEIHGDNALPAPRGRYSGPSGDPELVDGDAAFLIPDPELPANWHDWATPFLQAMRACGNVRVACAAAQVSRRAAYTARHLHPEFAEQWDDAMDDAIDIIEAKAWEVATKQNNAIMIIFLLKSLRPSVYKEQQRIDMVIQPDVSRLSEADLIKLITTGAVGEHGDG